MPPSLSNPQRKPRNNLLSVQLKEASRQRFFCCSAMAANQRILPTEPKCGIPAGAAALW
jgi:hypothetical protein